MSRLWKAIPALLLAACSCGGAEGAGKGTNGGGGDDMPKTTADPDARYAALEAGAEYASWQKMNTEPFFSKTHGKRMVDVYVNDIALEAFKDDEKPFPVGSVVVKTSWETKDKVATDVAGPIFVMEKKQQGYDPGNEDWWYALHWEQVPPEWRQRMGGTQTYWRSPSQKVGYCGGCHENFDRFIGGVPAEFQSWGAKEAADGAGDAK